uniref:Uncharacterized protein n=1 Tax=Arundo donax TaxID=35708 RepID=A0A0A8XT38_ARUDO
MITRMILPSKLCQQTLVASR